MSRQPGNVQKGSAELKKYRDMAPSTVEDEKLLEIIRTYKTNNLIMEALQNLWNEISDSEAVAGTASDEWVSSNKKPRKKLEAPTKNSSDRQSVRGAGGGRGRSAPPGGRGGGPGRGNGSSKSGGSGGGEGLGEPHRSSSISSYKSEEKLVPSGDSSEDVANKSDIKINAELSNAISSAVAPSAASAAAAVSLSQQSSVSAASSVWGGGKNSLTFVQKMKLEEERKIQAIEDERLALVEQERLKEQQKQEEAAKEEEEAKKQQDELAAEAIVVEVVVAEGRSSAKFVEQKTRSKERKPHSSKAPSRQKKVESEEVAQNLELSTTSETVLEVVTIELEQVNIKQDSPRDDKRDDSKKKKKKSPAGGRRTGSVSESDKPVRTENAPASPKLLKLGKWDEVEDSSAVVFEFGSFGRELDLHTGESSSHFNGSASESNAVGGVSWNTDNISEEGMKGDNSHAPPGLSVNIDSSKSSSSNQSSRTPGGQSRKDINGVDGSQKIQNGQNQYLQQQQYQQPYLQYNQPQSSQRNVVPNFTMGQSMAPQNALYEQSPPYSGQNQQVGPSISSSSANSSGNSNLGPGAISGNGQQYAAPPGMGHNIPAYYYNHPGHFYGQYYYNSPQNFYNRGQAMYPPQQGMYGAQAAYVGGDMYSHPSAGNFPVDSMYTGPGQQSGGVKSGGKSNGVPNTSASNNVQGNGSLNSVDTNNYNHSYGGSYGFPHNGRGMEQTIGSWPYQGPGGGQWNNSMQSFPPSSGSGAGLSGRNDSIQGSSRGGGSGAPGYNTYLRSSNNNQLQGSSSVGSSNNNGSSGNQNW